MTLVAPKVCDHTSTAYTAVAFSLIPRVLGLGDRGASPTAGCYDRNFWHYGIIDLANSRYQEASLLLALSYTLRREDNAFFDHTAVRQYAIDAVRFWASIQRRDGSFDEVYPHERSYVATAFSTFAVTTACQLLGLHTVDPALEKAGRWLARNENADVSNQSAGAAAALNAIGEHLEEDAFTMAAAEKRDRLLSAQNDEGWFPEYGGWDIGYLTISLAYLACLAQETGDDPLKAACHRAADFIEQRMRDDGTYDPVGSSRGTQYVYPSGLAILGRMDILARHEVGVSRGRALNPAWMDDRFCIPMIVDYLLAAKELEREDDNVPTDSATSA